MLKYAQEERDARMRDDDQDPYLDRLDDEDVSEPRASLSVFLVDLYWPLRLEPTFTLVTTRNTVFSYLYWTGPDSWTQPPALTVTLILGD